MSLRIQLGCILSSLFLVSCSGAADTQLLWTTGSTLENITEEIMGTQTILALWDSLTAGYGLEISESYPSKLENVLTENGYNYDVINAGVSGDTSKNLLDRAALYSEQNPDIVILAIGWNDGLRGQSVDNLKTNIQSIIDMYEWDSKIVLAGMEIPANLGLSYARNFKQVYFDLADENPDVYFHESFLEDVWGVPSLNQADRIHPTSEWYDIIVANLYEFLEDEDIIEQ